MEERRKIVLKHLTVHIQSDMHTYTSCLNIYWGLGNLVAKEPRMIYVVF